MPSIYKLTCSCGKSFPIEVSKAGQTIQCSCGNQLMVPSMLKMKKLPLWGDEDIPSSQADSSPSQKAQENVKENVKNNIQESSPKRAAHLAFENGFKGKNNEDVSAELREFPQKKKKKIIGTRKGILWVGIIFAVFFAFLFYRTYVNPPRPINVLTIQRAFWDGSRVIERDSNPITLEDIGFFVTEDNLVIDDKVIEYFNPFFAYKYFDYLKNGLDLSDNFADKYDSLVIRYRLMTTLYGVLCIGSLLLAGLFFFLLKKKRVVGTMQGAEWKK